jgi:hypothetical protein
MASEFSRGSPEQPELFSPRRELSNLIQGRLGRHSPAGEARVQGDGGRVISMAQTAAGRMYMDARKFPVSSQASGVRNQ